MFYRFVELYFKIIILGFVELHFKIIILGFVELYFKNIILGFLPIVFVFCVMLFDIILLDSECYPLFSYEFFFFFLFLALWFNILFGMSYNVLTL